MELPKKVEAAPEPKGPRVFLLDMPANSESAFNAAGFRVQVGSLGQPFEVKQSDGFVPVPVDRTLPVGWTESEIVIADLNPPDPLSEPRGKKVTSPGEVDWWAKCSSGVVDPRVRVALGMQNDCDRIYRHGGAFIVFMAPEIPQEVSAGRVGNYNRVETHQEIRAYPWSFLGVLHSFLNVRHDTGTDIRFDPGFEALRHGLGAWLHQATYSCTLGMPYRKAADSSALILKNKFDEPVGLVTNWEDQKGVVVLLPQVRDKTGTALAVIEHLLPAVTPDLFPDKVSVSWLTAPPYEHPSILRLTGEIAELRAALDVQIAGIETRINQIRAERGFLHDLLSESGDPLRGAVHRALSHLGLTVVDADASGEDQTHGLMEDLRIEGTSPLVLVEVKGIYGKPTDEDALQVAKYLAPAMKRTGRTDVKGLTIINHERHRPGEERDHTGLFRPLVLENALAQEVGLMTTWDLFWLCRNYETLGWNPAQVGPVFQRNGRIAPVPSHYKQLGLVEKVWPEAEVVGVRLACPVSRGDRIAVAVGWEFHEALVLSMQVNGADCGTASAGAGVGLRVDTWRAPSEGSAVFVIQPHNPGAGEDDPSAKGRVTSSTGVYKDGNHLTLGPGRSVGQAALGSSFF